MTLTAPRLLTFLVSLVLLGLVAASLYWRLPIPRVGPFVAKHRHEIRMAAWAVLAAGVLSRRL